MNLQALSNGLGAPSVLLLIMAIRREIPATVSITADTGWENDRLWNTGRRSTNEQYFNEVIVPLCKGSHVTPTFVRALDKHGQPLKSLRDRVIDGAKQGRSSDVPLFGSRGGRMRQTCTQKMKIRALHQEERRMGAKTACSAQGIHFYEADRRTKGIYLRNDGPWSIYQTTFRIRVKGPDGQKRSVEKPIKWQTHYYPLVDLKLGREEIYARVKAEGVPYLISSECDLCPHKDLARWERTSPEVIEDGAAIERLFNGNYFFTDRRIPLKEAIAAMKKERDWKKQTGQTEIDFGCKNDVCGV